MHFRTNNLILEQLIRFNAENYRHIHVGCHRLRLLGYESDTYRVILFETTHVCMPSSLPGQSIVGFVRCQTSQSNSHAIISVSDSSFSIARRATDQQYGDCYTGR